MAKALYIAEKPSVAQEFAKALKISGQRRDGYLESKEAVVTWCVGHLVTMSYPEKYDMKYKRWSLETLPFLPADFLYEVIPEVKKQFDIVSGLLNRPDIDVIYVCTDSGREGEYIYRLVAKESHVQGKQQKRVWIDSQTEEEILRGIREAKELSAYDSLAASAYLRAKEDYLMGINFSRLLTLKYSSQICQYLESKYQPVSVGRVMTCVLGMVVRREREIRSFVKTPFYRVISTMKHSGRAFEGEWRCTKESRYYNSPCLYKENGFKKKEDAEEFVDWLRNPCPIEAAVEKVERKKENKNPPLLFNLAELQNVCAKLFKISPDETLKITQELYEKKLVTYPRTDARVLSTAVAKVITRNLNGLRAYPQTNEAVQEILSTGVRLTGSRYVNDKQITDHYAIIPTGQGFGSLAGLSLTAQRVYEVIVRRFLCIFYPPAVYQKVSLVTVRKEERFFSSFKILISPGYLKIAASSFAKENASSKEEGGEDSEVSCDTGLMEALQTLKKGTILPIEGFSVKEGETSPPKRYNSGSMILAMENAGQLIEDEDLRAQIKGSGIGTSATRAEILKKLMTIKYLSLNKKTQVITPTLLGEMIFDVVNGSIRSLLNPELTASWEKGLTYVAEGTITPKEYMDKLEHFIRVRTDQVMRSGTGNFRQLFDASAQFYDKPGNTRSKEAGAAQEAERKTKPRSAKARQTGSVRGAQESKNQGKALQRKKPS
ncbi:MAG: DNA topoisomerase [Eubacteriales bacterium]|nr:DNA topoisomerase [Eubacteriales bacterium]